MIGRFTRASLLLLLTVAGAFGIERFPPPQFTDHQLPHMVNPLPRAELFAWLDVVLLAVALALAAWLVLKKRSRRGVIVLALLSLLYFGFYRHGCVCAVGSIQNVALALSGHGYALPAVVSAFFLLPLLFTIFFGRVFCAAVCPLGAAQEVVLIKPLKMPAWLEAALGLLPPIILGAAVLYAATDSRFILCEYDPIVPFFRQQGPLALVLAGAGLLLLATVIGRPYCRFLCPYGVLLRWLAPLAKWRVTITPDECVNCRLCEDACPYGAIRKPTPAGQGRRRLEGKGWLVFFVLLLPLLLAGGGWLGYRVGNVLALPNNTLRLAERLRREDAGQVKGTTLETDAVRTQGRSHAEIYRQALQIQREFALGGSLLGAWIGLLLGSRLIGLTIRRRRDDFDADPGACLACARCYRTCPVEQARKTGQPVEVRAHNSEVG